MAEQAKAARVEETKPISEMTLEEIQKQIAVTELETKKLQLGQAQKDNADFLDKEKRRSEANKQRMSELEQARNSRYATIKACRHKAGGTPANILKGGGVGSFSLLTRAIMPDGVTIFMQCPRCRLGMYTPQKKIRQMWFTKFEDEKKYFDELVEKSREEGLQHAELRGPTFAFKNDEGIPIIPERK